jgi:hypothetical protein
MYEPACTLDAGQRRNALIRLERNSIFLVNLRCRFTVDRKSSRSTTPGDGFLPNLPRNSAFAAATDCGMLGERPGHSHSMVAGGFPEMSYTTREMPATSLTILRETTSRNSYGRRAHCAVMKSTVSTARSAITKS